MMLSHQQDHDPPQSLLDLPAEVRVQVYKHLFDSAVLSIEPSYPSILHCRYSICSCAFPFHIIVSHWLSLTNTSSDIAAEHLSEAPTRGSSLSVTGNNTPNRELTHQSRSIARHIPIVHPENNHPGCRIVLQAAIGSNPVDVFTSPRASEHCHLVSVP